MTKDISPILEGWEHDPDQPQVRIVKGLDGRDKIQLRLDLGLLQLEMDGRPDGMRPHDFPSLLDYHRKRADEFGEAYQLEPEDCALLMQEGIQYYRRYVALFHLCRYDLVVRDTSRNLDLFAFVRRHASRDQDRLAFDQYRPYVTMMRAQALARQALELNGQQAALEAIDAGIAGILDFFREYDQLEQAPACPELNFLKRWRKEIDSSRKKDPISRLEEQLQAAVEQEQYEEAARIRDQIQKLRFVAPQDAADHSST